MTEIFFKSDMDVEYVNHMGNDTEIVDAAKASLGQVEYEKGKERGLITHMMCQNPPHSSVFEHCVLKVRMTLPITAHRQLMTHRTLSKNSESGRYTELKPVFWVPSQDRPLVNAGTSARPELVFGSEKAFQEELHEHILLAKSGWDAYQRSLSRGSAKEIARNHLPVTTYTSVIVTGNLWAWFHFLKTRAGYGGHPQDEIREVAKKVELLIEKLYPLAYSAWRKTLD